MVRRAALVRLCIRSDEEDSLWTRSGRRSRYSLNGIVSTGYICVVAWSVGFTGFTDEFGIWWEGLDEGEQQSVDVGVTAVLLLGGTKVGDDRWYEVHVPKADDMYDRHIEQLKREGVIDG